MRKGQRAGVLLLLFVRWQELALAHEFLLAVLFLFRSPRSGR